VSIAVCVEIRSNKASLGHEKWLIKVT
jgi:hypothetical protein